MNEIVKDFLLEYGMLKVVNPRIQQEKQVLSICEHQEVMEDRYFLYDEATITVTEEQIREYIFVNELDFTSICELVNNIKYFNELNYEFEGITQYVSGNIIIKEE